MNIAINCRHLLKGKLEGFGNYTFEVTKRICKNHPEHDFYLLFDRPYDTSFVFAKNCIPIVLFPPARHPFLNILWTRFSLHKALKKHKINLFWSPDGMCDLHTNIPQVITIHDLNFEHYPEDSPKLVSWYYRYFYPKFAQKSKHIITVSTYSKKDISSTYNIASEDISVIYNGISNGFVPVTKDDRIATQKQYTDGKPFFIFVGSIHPRKNVERLIQAFEIFHKKHTNYNLLIVGRNMWGNQQIDIPMKLNKTVRFTGHVELKTLNTLMGSAFSLVYPPYFEGFGIPLVEAMKCGTPIISSDQTCLPEIAGEAAIYFNPFDVHDIANKLERITTNDIEREKIIGKGLSLIHI